jgi:DNA polymerase-3 subunit beta
MKFTVVASEFAVKLQAAIQITSARSGSAVAGAVMVDVADTGVELRATDLQTSVRVPLVAHDSSQGRAVLPGRLLLEVVRMASGNEVTCELAPASNQLTVQSGATTVHLQTLREDDFPPIPGAEGEDVATFPGASFAQAVTQVTPAASRDETRPLLTGVLLTVVKDELRLVATDSYRLSVKEIKLEFAPQGDFDMVVPARALTEAARLTQQEGASEVSVKRNNNQIVFIINNIVLASRLLEGHFPDYKQLVPDTVEHELHFATSELLDTVRRVGLVAQKNNPLRVGLREGELTVSARTPDIGDACETLPSDFQGEGFEMGFNSTFLRDGLESADSPRVVLKLVSALRPGVIESDGDSGGRFVYLVMPVRLNT